MSLNVKSYKRWIVKNVAFNLAKITNKNGYTIDVQLVDISQQELHTIQTPAIIVTPTKLRRGYQVGQTMEFFLTFNIVPVLDKDDACIKSADDIVEAMEAFELDMVKCHHADLFLHTAFSTNPETPSELQSFYLRDHKLGDANYVYTKTRAYMLFESTAEYELVGQQSL